MHRTLVLAAALWMGCGLAAQAQTTPAPATIASLDVPRYMGTWHEIAKFPNRFQRDCASGTTAEYSVLSPGRLQVINSCTKADGSRIRAVGEARQLGAADSPKLEVRFAPSWLGWLPLVWGDYWVLDLDPAYQLAAVGSPSREYLWVLSRRPQVDAVALQALTQRLAAQGFAVEKLERTPQP